MIRQIIKKIPGIRRIAVKGWKFYTYMRDGLNFYKTCYINFKVLPWRKAVKFPILVFGKLKIYRLGKIVIEAPLFTGMIELGRNRDHFKASAGSAMLDNGGTIIFKGATRFSIDFGIYLHSDKSVVEIDKYCFFGNNVKLYIYNSLIIGKCNRIVSEVQIFDSGFHFMKNIETGEIKNIFGQVIVGNYCWVGNRVTLSKGTVLPDHTIVASNSLVNKDFTKEEYPLLGGMPAKKISSGVVRIFNRKDEGRLWNYFVEHKEEKSIYESPGLIDEYETVKAEYEGKL